MNTARACTAPIPTIRAGEIDFHHATPVISDTPKFIVPVPGFPDGEPLVYPRDHEHAGEPILGWDKTPIGEKGVVFWNARDSCWQAAADDGTHVVIINLVTIREANRLFDKFAELGGADRITCAGFKDFMAFATEIGLTDTYQSDTEYVRASMTPVMTDALQLEYAGVTMGFVNRNDDVIALAVYLEDPFEFINVAGVTQQMPHGGVVIRLAHDIHAIQPDIFQQTYHLAKNGAEIVDVATEIEGARLMDVA